MKKWDVDKTAKKLAKLQRKRRCGFFCRWRIRQLEKQIPPPAPLPEGPLPPEIPGLTPEPVAPPVAAGGPATMNGYFGDWTWQ